MNGNILEKLSLKNVIAIRKSWMLLLILICIQLPLKIMVVERQWLNFAELLLINSLLFSWYFLSNKAWLSVIKIFVLMGILLLTQSSLLTSMIFGQVEEMNKGWLYELLSISITILIIFLITRIYLKEEKVKYSKKNILKTFLLTSVFLFTISNNSIIDENFFLFQNRTINTIFTQVIKAIYSISLMSVVYYLFGIIRRDASLFTIPTVDLRLFSNRFFKVFPMLYIPLFILFLSLLGEVFLETIVTVHHSLSFVTILHYASQITLFIVLILIIGQVLKYKAIQEKSYYGIFGILLFIPVVNILFYLFIGLNKHHLILESNNSYSKKHWHALIGLLLLWGVYCLVLPSGNSELFLLHTLIFVLFLLVSVINIGKMWQIALLFAAINVMLSGAIDYAVSYILFLLSAPRPSLLTFEGVLTMSLIFAWYYAIIYSVRHVFLYEEDWEGEIA